MSICYHHIIAFITIVICVTSCQETVSPNLSTGGECYSLQIITKACESQLSTIDASLITVNADGCADITSVADHPCIANLK